MSKEGKLTRCWPVLFLRSQGDFSSSSWREGKRRSKFELLLALVPGQGHARSSFFLLTSPCLRPLRPDSDPLRRLARRYPTIDAWPLVQRLLSARQRLSRADSAPPLGSFPSSTRSNVSFLPPLCISATVRTARRRRTGPLSTLCPARATQGSRSGHGSGGCSRG